MIVLIDDRRTFLPSVCRREDYVLLETCTEALEWFKSIEAGTRIDQIWFDHDLGMVNGEIEDVMPVVKYLEDRFEDGTAPDIGQILVHTSNGPGGKDIVAAFEKYVPLHRFFGKQNKAYLEDLRPDPENAEG